MQILHTAENCMQTIGEVGQDLEQEGKTQEPEDHTSEHPEPEPELEPESQPSKASKQLKGKGKRCNVAGTRITVSLLPSLTIRSRSHR